MPSVYSRIWDTQYRSKVVFCCYNHDHDHDDHHHCLYVSVFLHIRNFRIMTKSLIYLATAGKLDAHFDRTGD